MFSTGDTMQLTNAISHSALSYLILGCLLFLAMLAYVFVARRCGIIDIPNERSSHNQPTVSGAGLLFPFAAVLWFVLSGMQHTMIIIAMLLLTLVSFIDDLRQVNARLRVLFHFIAAGILLYSLGLSSLQWYVALTAYLLVVGYINAGNFMDGINGMTAFFYLVTLGSFMILENFVPLVPMVSAGFVSETQIQQLFPQGLVEILFLSVLVFSFFNARKKALVFAGDAGSISLSFIIAWLLILLMLATGNIFWILLIATYGIDTAYTMIVRLRQREQALEAHRIHLHHLLVDVKRYPHLTISASYAITQLLINVLTTWMIITGYMNVFSFLVILIGLVIVYAFFRSKVVNVQSERHAGSC